jgi:protein gp37
MPWPLPNVWLGVSAENQQWADIRIPALLDTPAAVRFVSAEPLLGPIDLGEVAGANCGGVPNIDWLIVGGESGPGARPMSPDWASDLRNQCTESGVAFLFKQWGSYRCNGYIHQDTGRSLTAHEVTPWSANANGFMPVMERVGKGAAGRMLGGRTWDEYPQAVTA